MSDVAAVLVAFHEATGREAAFWERRDGSRGPTLLGASSPAFGERTADGPLKWDVPLWATSQGIVAHLATTGDSVGWLLVEPGQSEDADRLLTRLIPMVLRLANERDGAAQELAGRDGEINLLYAISELLGGSTSVDDVADTLLQELAITVGARRAVFLRTNRAQTALRPIAALGLGDTTYEPIAIDSATHIAARAFRSATACTEEGVASSDADPVLGAECRALLAVAITRPSTGIGITGPHPAITARRPNVSNPEGIGSVPLGVIVLGGHRAGGVFTTGDRKLANAIGAQIGTAMHNSTLVRAALERQQLEREMRLAHDLQLKLLPQPRVVGPEGRAAARVVAAESVGGDFFLLARLDRDRTGVLIGDVAGHGYQAALVMALALSAAAIHVQAAFDPSIALEAVQRSLADELASTDMSLSLCYVVIDSRVGELRFANAGHPHAFRVGRAGDCTRLAAVAPAIGFGDMPIEECVMAWRPGDRVVLFTDGLPDALDASDARLGEPRILDLLASMSHDETPDDMLDRLVRLVERHVAGTPLRDDLAAVIVDRPT